MKKQIAFCVVSCALLLCTSLATGQGRAQGLGWDYQEQARSRNYDMKHIVLNISFDESQKKVMGTISTTMSLLSQRAPVKEILFDSHDLSIQKVWMEMKGKKTDLKFDTTTTDTNAKYKLHVWLNNPPAAGQDFTVNVQYWGIPKKGMYFIQPDTFYTKRPTQIWTQGEGEDNRYWFPTYDYPNDKTTTEMFVTVKANQQALSNGKLVGKKANKDGTVTWHYAMEHPHSTYLVMLGIGDYKVVEDKWKNKPVQYWVYPDFESEAHRIFGQTPKMIDFFSTKTGVDYAWEKYAQIAIADFMYGGMENTGATTLNDYVMFDKKGAVDFNPEGLIAHELAHQWFGDYVTCRSWMHMWLNESFATYFEGLFREYADGEDEFQEEMVGQQWAGITTEIAPGKRPIITTNGYTSNTYSRGAATLNMIRHILGDEGWWASIHHYLESHKFDNVLSEDLKQAIEETTGQNLRWFFDEFLYKSGHPVFDVSYTYDDAAKMVRLHVAQTQKRDSLTGTFKIPIDVELTMPNGVKTLETLRIQDSSSDFNLSAPMKPAMLIFDKGSTTIKEVHFNRDPKEWIYQLQNAPLAIERSEAARALGDSNPAIIADMAAMQALKDASQHGAFWATRLHAYESLSKNFMASANDPAFVETMLKDPRSEIRVKAIENLQHSTNREFALATVRNYFETDSSWRVRNAAMKTAAHLDPMLGYKFGVAMIGFSSPRDRVRQDAIEVLRDLKRPECLQPIIALLGQHDIPKASRWEAIKALGHDIAIDSAKITSILWNLTNNGDRAIRNTALNELADHSDSVMLKKIEAQSMERPEMKDIYDGVIKKMRTRLGVTD